MSEPSRTQAPSSIRRVYYRFRQLSSGLTATVDAKELCTVANALPSAAVALFQRMPIDAQRHSLNVYSMLQSSGETDLELGAAALLHDVGKVAAEEAGVHINLWARGPLVLLETLAHAHLLRLASDEPARGWRYALHVHIEHPTIGATWAAQAGCSESTCWLIAQHQNKNANTQDKRLLELLHALQWADNMN